MPLSEQDLARVYTLAAEALYHGLRGDKTQAMGVIHELTAGPDRGLLMATRWAAAVAGAVAKMHPAPVGGVWRPDLVAEFDDDIDALTPAQAFAVRFAAAALNKDAAMMAALWRAHPTWDEREAALAALYDLTLAHLRRYEVVFGPLDTAPGVAS